jgi:hypothetical protein
MAAQFPLHETARIVRRNPRSPKIVAVHHNACPALAERPGPCTCECEYRIVKGGRGR